jgi:very-short-patch-repair endonuclease
MSIKAIANQFGVSRGLINKRLKSIGIVPRTRSDAMFVRMSQTSKKERIRLTKAAHDSIRGQKQNFEHRCKLAITLENKGIVKSLNERKLIKMLKDKGFDDIVPQKAFGPYNIDVALSKSRISVEIFGGGWHAHGLHAKRFAKRIKYILDCGWTPIIIWIDERTCPLGVGAIEYIITLSKKISTSKALRCKEHMIRGNGNTSIAGYNKFYDRSIIPTT